jgi:hypothetical protein
MKGGDLTAAPQVIRYIELPRTNTFQWPEFWRLLQRLPIDVDARQRLAIGSGRELDGIPLECHFPCADAEETTNLDHESRDPALFVDDQVGDAADLLPASILYRAADQVVGQVLIPPLLAHDRIHADGRSLTPLCSRRFALAGSNPGAILLTLPCSRGFALAGSDPGAILLTLPCSRGLALARCRDRWVAVPLALHLGGHAARLELGRLSKRIALDVEPGDRLVVLVADLDGVPAHAHQAASGLALEPPLVTLLGASRGLALAAIVGQHARPGHLQEFVVHPHDQPCDLSESVDQQVRDFPDPLALAILCGASDQILRHELIRVLRGDEGLATMVPDTSRTRLLAIALRQHQRWRHQ